MAPRRRMQRAAAVRRLTRRGVLTAAGGTVAAFVAACSGGSNENVSAGSEPGAAGGSGAPATQTAQEPPSLGGILNQRISADPQPLDPHQSTTHTALWPVAPCFNQLLQFDPAKASTSPQDILPDLAARWEQPEPTTLIFTLKPGVTFHDGAPFTSQDPKAQLEWIQSPPASKSSPRRGALLALDAIETPDTGTLRLRLKQPAPSLLINLAGHAFAIGRARDILANGDVSATLNGTGPFRLRRSPRSNLLTLERNPAYHVPGRPYLDGLTFTIEPDYVTALTGFIGGQYHLLFDPAFKLADHDRVTRETNGRAEIALVPSTRRAPLYVNARHRPFDDPRVRQAISLALDRDAAIKVINEGNGRRGGYMAPKGVWAISEGDLKRFEGYDKPGVEKAKSLLVQAGVLTPIEASAVTRTEFQGFGEFVRDQLGKIGINVRLTLADAATAQAALQRGDFDLGPWLIALPVDDPDATFAEVATTKAPKNWSAVADPQIDALFDKQSQIVDFEDRRKAVQDLERQALAQYQMSVMYFEDVSFARSRSVRNLVFQDSLFTNRRMEHVWLKE